MLFCFFTKMLQERRRVKWGKNLYQTLVGSPCKALPDLPFMLTCSCYLHTTAQAAKISLQQICPLPTTPRAVCNQGKYAWWSQDPHYAHLSTMSNIPLKSNCHWYLPFFPPLYRWCYFCYIAFLWFSIKGTSSQQSAVCGHTTSRQDLSCLQTVNTNRSITLSLLLSKTVALKILASQPPW